MEFLKSHYEKLILGVMLLLMAVGAVLLVLEVGTVQDELQKFKDMSLGNDGKPPQQEDLGELIKALTQVTNPPKVEFAKVHKVFNPDAWYVDTNGNLIAGTNVGVERLIIQSITPQYLKVEFDSIGSTNPGRESVKLKVTREFMKTLAEQGKRTLTLSLNSTNVSNTLDPANKAQSPQLFVRGIAGTPEAPEVKLELVEPGKDSTKFTISKALGFAHVIEHVTHIVYPVESNHVWRVARKGQPLSFAGDTNIVVEITATNVVVRAISNDKHTTIPFGTNQPAQLRPKTP
ncbi:MAG: hypothetical protein ABMA26_06660 [Limisphaerales bacterium]